MNQSGTQQPLLTTLGTAVIDELHFNDGTVSKDVLGGSGVHSAVGARLFLSGLSSKSICGLLHIGFDFPTSAEHLIYSWKSGLELDWNAGQHTASNKVTFEDSTMGPQSRNYVHPSIFTRPNDLPARALQAKAFHLTCPLHELRAQVESIEDKRPDMLPKSLVIWEPWPKACLPENQHLLSQTLGFVDVFSPNHLELMSLFGFGPEAFNKYLIENLATRCAIIGVGNCKQGVVIVRCGEHGALLLDARLPNLGASASGSRDGVHKLWIPPFHTDPEKVVCTIGAGNAFLGGLAVGWVETGNWVKACCYATVAASFLVEQVGLPVRTGLGPFELWNGDSVFSRLEMTMTRIQEALKA